MAERPGTGDSPVDPVAIAADRTRARALLGVADAHLEVLPVLWLLLVGGGLAAAAGSVGAARIQDLASFASAAALAYVVAGAALIAEARHLRRVLAAGNIDHALEALRVRGSAVWLAWLPAALLAAELATRGLTGDRARWGLASAVFASLLGVLPIGRRRALREDLERVRKASVVTESPRVAGVRQRRFGRLLDRARLFENASHATSVLLLLWAGAALLDLIDQGSPQIVFLAAAPRVVVGGAVAVGLTVALGYWHSAQLVRVGRTTDPSAFPRGRRLAFVTTLVAIPAAAAYLIGTLGGWCRPEGGDETMLFVMAFWAVERVSVLGSLRRDVDSLTRAAAVATTDRPRA